MTNAERSSERYDAVVVGAGPAGLSAALILGRSCRRVLVADAGPGRNAVAEAVHSFFTRDGAPPAELLRIGRKQLSRYAVTIRDESVSVVERMADGFGIVFEGGERVEARRLLFAIGVRDVLPPIEGFEELWGRGVFHCPYCHGWEVAGRPLALYGRGDSGRKLAKLLLGWSSDLILFTDGPATLDDEQRAGLETLGVAIRDEPVERLIVGADGGLEAVALKGGEEVARSALFLEPQQVLRSDLPRLLGCKLTEEGVVETDEAGKTSVHGVYVAGDAGANPQHVLVAAATGARAAVALNHDLLTEEFDG